MPIGLLAGLPADQVEAILLHELAHIRRWDYLVNVFQRFAEGLLFYHPAVWWISRVIRAERENCCDDAAVAVSGDARGYAVALAALEENRWPGREPAVAATGGSLVKRIRRLLYPKAPNGAWTPLFAAAILIATAALALAAWHSQEGAAAQTPYEKWVNEDVAYIISPEERAAFLKLKTDEEREKFVEQFWLRRDPTPGTPENEYKMEHYRRIAYANQRFSTATTPGWKTGRGRAYIMYGPADEVESHPSATPPWEAWRYRHIEQYGDNVVMRFEETATGDYRLVEVAAGR
jgi:GWxTD domain-containing protein